VETQTDFFRVCETYLDHDHPMALEPAEQLDAELSHSWFGALGKHRTCERLV